MRKDQSLTEHSGEMMFYPRTIKRNKKKMLMMEMDFSNKGRLLKKLEKIDKNKSFLPTINKSSG
jgi:hypothetical protein